MKAIVGICFITYWPTILYMLVFILYFSEMEKMASCMSTKVLLRFYEVKVKLTLGPMMQRPLISTLPAFQPKTEPPLLLQPAIHAFTILVIKLTYCMAIFYIWKQYKHRSFFSIVPEQM